MNTPQERILELEEFIRNLIKHHTLPSPFYEQARALNIAIYKGTPGHPDYIEINEGKYLCVGTKLNHWKFSFK